MSSVERLAPLHSLRTLLASAQRSRHPFGLQDLHLGKVHLVARSVEPSHLPPLWFLEPPDSVAGTQSHSSLSI